MEGRPRISVVVPTLGDGPALERVVAGLREQTVPAVDIEVLLALDVAGGGEAERRVETLVGGAGVVRAGRPGASANRNAGARAASAPLVLFCDDDTIPVPEMVAEHLRWHESHPEAEVAVLGLVRWSKELDVTVFMRWLDRGIQFDYPFITGVEAGWGRFFSANVSVKRDFFDAVGGFDEVQFPFGYEDLDFGLRADKAGMRLLYNRNAIADHLRPGVTPEFWLRRIRRVAVAEHRFSEVHPEIEPWFKRIFEHVAAQPPASGRGRALARWIGPDVPWIGPKVWNSTDLYFKQLLAPEFLDAWAEAEAGTTADGPDLSERAG
jgi:GT2 family glycosyltransferase